MTLSPYFRLGLALAVIVVVLDQALKWWILDVVMQPPRVIEVTPFFNLVMTWNRGISFGLFNTDSPWNALILSIVAIVISAALAVWMVRADSRTIALGLGLIIGGAIGNLVDRLRFGAVADFLDLHAWGWHWPAFNVADAAITVGVALLIADSLFGRAEDRKTEVPIGRDAGE